MRSFIRVFIGAWALFGCVLAGQTAAILDTTFQPPTLGGAVRVLAVQADDRILIGGEFTTVDGVPRQGVARLNPGGLSDPVFNAGAGTDRPVRAIVLVGGQQVIIGGRFGSVNGIPRRWVARLSSEGVVDPDFVPELDGFDDGDGGVVCIAATADGHILVGGAFRSKSDPKRFGLARLRPDGSLDPSFKVSMSDAYYPALAVPNFSIVGLATLANGKILLAAAHNIAGFSDVPLMRLNADGSIDPTYATTVGQLGNPNAFFLNDAQVTAWLPESDGAVILARRVTTFTPRETLGTTTYFAKFQANGEPDISFQARTNFPVSILAPQAGGWFLAAGGFLAVDGQRVPGFARFSTAGTWDGRFAAPWPTNRGALAFATQSGNRTVVSLETRAGASEGPRLARFLSVQTTGAPVIQQQPVSQKISPGKEVSFRVTASGSPLNYQWRFNDAPIPAATNDTLVVIATEGKNEGAYDVIVSNESGSATSQRAVLKTVSILDALEAAWVQNPYIYMAPGNAGPGPGDSVISTRLLTAQSGETHDGEDAVQFGPGSFEPSLGPTYGNVNFNINPAYGPGTLSFWWKTARPGTLAVTAGNYGFQTNSAGGIWVFNSVHLPAGWSVGLSQRAQEGEVFYLDELQFRPDLDLSLKVTRDQPGGGTAIEFNLVAALGFTLQTSTNLRDWTNSGTYPRTNALVRWVDTNTSPNQQRFYRTVVAP